MAGEQVEKFAPNGGQLTGPVGLLVGVGLIVLWVVDSDGVALWVGALGPLLVVVMWTTTFRPRVWVEPGTLVLRNMLDIVRMPLAAIEEIAVRQVMAVRIGGRRYTNAGVGRTMRQALKGSAAQRARQGAGGLRGELAQVVEPGVIYADFVEHRLRDLITEDRLRRRVELYSPEMEALAADVRRDRAWPEIVALAVTLVLVVLAFALG